MAAFRRGPPHTFTVLPLIQQLNDGVFDLVLASGSPRRREVLGLMGINTFQIQASNFAEDLDKASFASPEKYCLATCSAKVQDVIAHRTGIKPNTVVLGADTIVVVDGMILEKPADDNDAKRMLLLLSGRTHLVHTAVTIHTNAIVTEGGELHHYTSFVETSKVTLSALSEQDIVAYIATGEGRDKAGAYAIQGRGGQLVTGVEGCYFNIVGLPMHAVSRSLAQLIRAASAAKAEHCST